jgi:Lysine methyltransferase
VLELGSGTGLVGLALAAQVAHLRLTMTDLDEALELLGLNISSFRREMRHIAHVPGVQSELTCESLVWGSPLSPTIQRTSWDLVLVSECTYNDCLAELASTVGQLARASPGVIILVSTKRRHRDEAGFFEVMANEGLLVAEHVALAGPAETGRSASDGWRRGGLVDPDADGVDIFHFRKVSPTHERTNPRIPRFLETARSYVELDR